jgi:hypothetical protein
VPVCDDIPARGAGADLQESRQAAAFLRHNHTRYGDQLADLFERLLGTSMCRGETLGGRSSQPARDGLSQVTTGADKCAQR